MVCFKRLPEETARQYAYRSIRENIISLDFLPGQNLTVRGLSEVLDISRTPIREAMLQLQFEDIVQVFPQSGCRVAYIDFKIADDSRFARLAIEVAVIQELCKCVTDEQLHELEKYIALQQYYGESGALRDFYQSDRCFHEMLFQFAGRINILKTAEYRSIHFERIRVLWLQVATDDWQRVLQEHMDIVKALKDRDVRAARSAIEKHLPGYPQEVSDYLHKVFPNYFCN